VVTPARSKDDDGNECDPLKDLTKSKLRGWKPFYLHDKQKAIANLLNVSSFTVFLVSRDVSIVDEMNALCLPTKDQLLSSKTKNTTKVKYPVSWNTAFCTDFIFKVDELVEKDRKILGSKTTG
jgi:hypothetical protein